MTADSARDRDVKQGVPPSDRIMTIATLVDRLREAVARLPQDAPPRAAPPERA